MIITGGIGSGKTLSIVKEIVDRGQKCFTNFNLVNIPYTRLKQEHLIIPDPEDKKKHKVNFKFWNDEKKKGGFDIHLDEFHNLMNSRRGMSKGNVLLSNWLSQIRKVLGESECNNLYLITQKLRRIDVNSRDLCTRAIKCYKQVFNDIPYPTEIYKDGKIIVKELPLTMIYKYYFQDADSLNAYEQYGINTCIGITRFVGNNYFKYYDSYALVEMGADIYI